MKEKIEELRRIMTASRDDEMKEARNTGGMKMVFPTDIVQEYFEGYAHALRDLEQMFPENETHHTIARAKYGKLRLLKKRESKCQSYIVAENYDEATGSWVCGHYFDDLDQATDKFNEILFAQEMEEDDAIRLAIDLRKLVKDWKDRIGERTQGVVLDYKSATSVQLATQMRDADMILDEIEEQLEKRGYNTDGLDD